MSQHLGEEWSFSSPPTFDFLFPGQKCQPFFCSLLGGTGTKRGSSEVKWWTMTHHPLFRILQFLGPERIVFQYMSPVSLVFHTIVM